MESIPRLHNRLKIRALENNLDVVSIHLKAEDGFGGKRVHCFIFGEIMKSICGKGFFEKLNKGDVCRKEERRKVSEGWNPAI